MNNKGEPSTWGDIKSLPGPLKFRIYLGSRFSGIMDSRNGIVKYHGVPQPTINWNDNDEVEYWDEPVYPNWGGRSKRRRTKRRATRKRKTNRKK